MNQKSTQYFHSFPWHNFTGKNQVQLAFKYFPAISRESRKAIIFFPGQGEPVEKYHELFFDIKNIDFHQFAFDHRGQGRSERILNNKPRLGFVQSYDDYVEDLHKFIEFIHAEYNISEIHLVAHSMGGAIATLLALQHPDQIKTMVLCSPMFKVVTSPYPYGLARLMTKIFVNLGLGESFPLGKSDFNIPKDFAGNPFTGSQIRFEEYRDLIKSKHDLGLDGPSNRWVHESFTAMEKLNCNAHLLKTPTLILQAGDDQIVNNEGHNDFVRNAGEAKRFITIHPFEDAKHEIFVEVDTIREKAIELALVFIQANSDLALIDSES